MGLYLLHCIFYILKSTSVASALATYISRPSSHWLSPYKIYKSTFVAPSLATFRCSYRLRVGTHYYGLLKETYSSTRRATLFGSWEHKPSYHIYRVQQILIHRNLSASKHFPASTKIAGFG